MGGNGIVDRLRQEPLPALLLGLACLSGIVAAAVGADVVMAVVGALLVTVIWVLERQAARTGGSGSFNRAVLVGLAGMALRLAIVVVAFVVIALADRSGLPAALAAFTATYTIYLFARLWRHPAVTSPR